jgi:hypothetical protein
MSELTWEWTLPMSEPIVARVDPKTHVESIYVGQRLVSRSGAGGKPEGHTVSLASRGAEGAYREGAPQELHLRFDPALSDFQMRANGQRVHPARAPGPPPPEARPGHVYPMPPMPSYAHSSQPSMSAAGGGRAKLAVLLVVAVAAVSGGVAGVRQYLAGARAAATPAGSIAASTGLLTAHYPAGFKASEVSRSSPVPAGPEDPCPQRVCTVQFSLVRLERVGRDEGVFLASFKMNGLKIGVDPWRVSNLLHDKFEDLAKLQGTDYAETERQDVTCLGEPGAAVSGHFSHKGEAATMWSCTFLRDGNAFWVGSFVNAKHAADDAELRAIVEATALVAKR